MSDSGEKTRGRKGPVGEKRQFLVHVDPEVVKSVKMAALELDKTASFLVEEAVRDWLAKNADRLPAGSTQTRNDKTGPG